MNDHVSTNATLRPADHPPVAAGRIGVLLVNLGTPDATDYWSMRRYLKEFLSDRRVIEENRLKWWLVLNLIILTMRPSRKGRDYDKIWNRERDESPLKTITRAQAEKLGATLAPLDGRRHGRLGDALRQPVDRVAARCAAASRLRPHPGRAALSAIRGGHDGDRRRQGVRCAEERCAGSRRCASRRPGTTIRSTSRRSRHRSKRSSPGCSFKPEVILASFHGVPKDYLLKGDPYHCQCQKTARLLRTRLGLDESRFMLTFQSRFGTRRMAAALHRHDRRGAGRSGVKNLAIVTPGLRRRLPGNARRDRGRKRRDLPPPRRREFRRDPLPERQRSRHESDFPRRQA